MKDCRLCGGRLAVVLDLGEMPLANRYRRANELLLPEPRFPLQLCRCQTCRHVQLGDTVDARDLYVDRPYLYASGTSEAWRKHCAKLAASLPWGKGKLAIDIGSNDGTLLHHLHARGYWVMGVEPAEVFLDAHPYASLPMFWGTEAASWVLAKFGRVDVLTATNVFAHVDDPVRFLAAAASVLKDDGRLVIECPSLEAMLTTGSFDQVYHEHLHYWQPHLIADVAWKAGMTMVKAEPIPVHGGSIRYTLTNERRRSLWSQPVSLTDLNLFADRATTWMEAWRDRLTGWRDAGKVVWGYGASAKGMTILNAVPVPEAVTRIVDDNPQKQGWYCPGQPIPITAPEDLTTPDVVINFAWNWASVIDPRIRASGFAGDLVHPF